MEKPATGSSSNPLEGGAARPISKLLGRLRGDPTRGVGPRRIGTITAATSRNTLRLLKPVTRGGSGGWRPECSTAGHARGAAVQWMMADAQGTISPHPHSRPRGLSCSRGGRRLSPWGVASPPREPPSGGQAVIATRAERFWLTALFRCFRTPGSKVETGASGKGARSSWSFGFPWRISSASSAPCSFRDWGPGFPWAQASLKHGVP